MSRPSPPHVPSAARAPRRLSAQARRGELVDAALREFSSRGYYLTQMETVAATAGVSKALVYQHFPSKEELFATVTQQVVEGFMGRLPDVLNRADDALGAWRGVVGLFCDLVTERPDAWVFVARHVNHPELGTSLRGLWEQISEAFAVVLAGAHEPQVAMASEEMVVEHARLTLPLIVSALQGLMSWWLEHPEVPRVKVEAWAVDFGWLVLDRIRRGERLHAVITADSAM